VEPNGGPLAVVPDEKTPTAALGLGKPLDEFPPLPPRPVERQPMDLSHLDEAPILEVDSLGHSSKIRGLSFSHDGRYLISAGYDKTVRVWSPATGELLRTIRGEIGQGPAGRIYSVSLSQDDELLAVGGWLGKYEGRVSSSSSEDAHKIRILDFYTGNTLRLLSGHYDVVLSLSFSHFGKRLASGGGDRQARIWDAATGNLERTLSGHNAGVSATAFSPDDRWLATGSLDNTAKLWDAQTGQILATLTGHSAPVEAVVFTPDGRYLLTGSLDRTIRLWDGKTGAFIKVMAQQDSGVSSLSMTSDGRHVVTGCADGKFTNNVFTVPEGRAVTRFAGHDNIVLATSVSPNGKWAATAGGSDFGIALWDLKTGQESLHLSGHGATVWSVGFSADGNQIAWGNRFDQKGQSEYQLNGPLQHGFVVGNSGPAFGYHSTLSFDLGYVRAQTKMGGLEVRTPNGKEHSVLEIWENGRRISQITRDVTTGFDHRSFTLNNDASVVISGGANGTLTSYATRSGSKLRDFVGHTGDVLAVAISPNGQWLVSGSADQTVRLWNISTGALMMTLFESRNGQWVSYTPSGYYASSAYGDGYVGWHINRGAQRTAAYYPANSLATQFRYDSVVLNYLGFGGNLVQALERANQTRPSWQPPIVQFRFEELPQFAPPSVYLMEPGVDTTVKADRIQVRAKAYSATNEPVTELTFLVNGRQVDPRWWQAVGRPSTNYSGRYAEIYGTLPLPESVNRISIVAKNRFNTAEPQTIEVKRIGGTGELERIFQPDIYVFSVGISNYSSPELEKLLYAHDDAKAIAEAFQKQAGKLYAKAYVRTLTEYQATQKSILDGLKWLKNVGQKDIAVIFLAGHAVQDNHGNYYFIPYGGDLSNVEKNGIRWSEFQGVLDSLPSKVLLLADTCHGGSITGKSERARGAPRRDLTQAIRASLSAGSGVVVMTASTEFEDSFENDKWKHGAFTKALLDGLSGQADYDTDRAVYIRELDHFVTKRVQKLTEGRQHPTTEVPRSMPNFPISYR
jgi:WD40 repeat protein